jgi:hypothetical protein
MAPPALSNPSMLGWMGSALIGASGSNSGAAIGSRAMLSDAWRISPMTDPCAQALPVFSDCDLVGACARRPGRPP